MFAVRIEMYKYVFQKSYADGYIFIMHVTAAKYIKPRIQQNQPV